MDEHNGESEEEGMMDEGIGRLEMEEFVPEWGWRRDRGSWFQRQDEA